MRKRQKCGTRSWRLKRELEDSFAHKPSADDTAPAPTIGKAAELFIQNKTIERVNAGTLEKYTRELDRLRHLCERHGAFTVANIMAELLIFYAHSWEKVYPSTQTRGAVKSRLSGFLRFCYEMTWLHRIPKLPKIKVEVAPTLPLNADEYGALLKACEMVETPVSPAYATALVQLMR